MSDTARPALGLADEDVQQGDFSRMSWREALDALQAQYRVLQQLAACKERPIVIADADLSNLGAPKFWVTAEDSEPEWYDDEEVLAVFE